MTQVVDVPLLVLFHEVDLVEAVLDAAADLCVESSLRLLDGVLAPRRRRDSPRRVDGV